MEKYNKYKKLILSCCIVGISNICYANPEILANQRDITLNNDGNSLNIIQHNDKAIIDWKSFDIGKSEITKFIQPSADSIAINRVHNAQASQILGKLEANGKIILINPNGIMIGKDATINTASFLATTSNASNYDDINNIVFDQHSTNNNAQIINEGTITAAEAGLVGLVSPRVINNGIIRANLGKVVLASADKFTVDLYGNNLFEFAIENTEVSQKIEHNGNITANDGIINITAAAGRKIVDNIIEIKGELKAPSITKIGNKIIISAEGSNAVHKNITSNKNIKQGVSIVKLLDSLLDASSPNNDGGNIIITADNISLEGNTHLDVSGKNNAGEIYIGGDYQGKGTLATALNTYIGKNIILNADSTNNGNGGKIIVWADNNTSYNGHISAKGGIIGGDGGFVEISGKKHLDFNGTVSTIAQNKQNGKNGTLLLDPDDIEIVTAGANVNSLNDGALNITGENRPTTTTISPAVIEAASQGTNVILTTDGDITLSETIDNLLNDLTLNAATMSIASGVSILSQTSFQPNININIENDSSSLDLSIDNTSSNSVINTGGNINIISKGSVILSNINSLYSTLLGNNGISIEAKDFSSTSRQINPNTGSLISAQSGTVKIKTTGPLTINAPEGNPAAIIANQELTLTSEQSNVNIEYPSASNNKFLSIMNSAQDNIYINAANNINLNTNGYTFLTNYFLLMTANAITQQNTNIANPISNGKTLAIISGSPIISENYITSYSPVIDHKFGINCGTDCISQEGGNVQDEGQFALFSARPIISVTGLIAQKIYDKTTTTTITDTAVANGALFNDVLSIAGTPIGNFNSPNVGTQNIAISGLSISTGSNYNYELDSNIEIQGAINPKPLDINVNSVDRVYDGTNFAHIPTQNITTSLNDILAVDIFSAEYASPDVGNNLPVTITSSNFGKLSGINAANYKINSATASSSNITPKPLDIYGIFIESKIYNGNKNAVIDGNPYVEPLAADATQVVLSGQGIATFSNLGPANNIPINISGYSLSGAKSANYILDTNNFTANIFADKAPKNKDIRINLLELKEIRAKLNNNLLHKHQEIESKKTMNKDIENMQDKTNQIMHVKPSNSLLNELYSNQLRLIELKMQLNNTDKDKEKMSISEELNITRKNIKNISLQINSK
jgi:filamentous hemagglutinin family protein